MVSRRKNLLREQTLSDKEKAGETDMREIWTISGIRFFLAALLTVMSFSMILTGCSRMEESLAEEAGSQEEVSDQEEISGDTDSDSSMEYTLTTKVTDVTNDPAFGDYWRLIFPVDRTISDDLELQDVGDILVWYNNVNPDGTVEIANYLRDQAVSGQQIFYDIYTEEEKAEDPDKEDTGLFFFRGDPGAKTAIINAGGGFMYVAAMHDSLPHALELSRRGYNAFALIYRPGAQTACKDLARAIGFIFEHADALEVDTSCYSLWGGSAGGRMAAWLGTYGPAAFGGDDLPQPGAIVMQYTGHSEYSEADPPTFACV